MRNQTISSLEELIEWHKILYLIYRSTLQYTSSDTPFLPVRNNLQGPSLHSSTLHTSSSRNGNGIGTMSGLTGNIRISSYFFDSFTTFWRRMLFYETLFHNNIFSCLGIHGVLHSRAGTLSGDPVGVRRGFSPPRFEKGLTRKCSWRCVAIFFVVLAVILSAALAYITGKNIN